MPGGSRTDLLVLAGATAGALLIGAVPVPGLTTAGGYAVATMFFAAVLWVTGALPLPVTALLIPVWLVAFGVYADFGDAVAGFADPVIFLMLAGFMLAEAMGKHGIDRRIALAVLARLGTSPRRLVLALMVATALLSMVVSNTATTAMMVPIALGLVGQVTETVPAGDGSGRISNLQIAALLGVAYAASLGGVGTLIGTPPNAIVVGQLDELLGVRITFVDWLAIGMPMVVVTLPVAWYLLLWIYPPEVGDVGRARERASEDLRAAGPLDPMARRVLAVFAATAGLWLLGGLGFLFGWLPAPWFTTLFGGAGESVFGTTGHQGVLFFVVVGLLAVPALVVAGTVEWDDLTDIDWGTLLLLGGGISLANALADTDATAWLADVTVGPLAGAPLIVILVAVVALTVSVGELASNTAMAAILAPLLVNVGPAYAAELGGSVQASVFLALTGAVAASYGFALPVATPPNAIAFGAGYVRREHMLRAGVLLDAVVILLTAGMVWLLVRFVWPLVV